MWPLSRLRRRSAIEQNQTACSCSSADVDRYYINPVTPQLKADLPARLAIKLAVGLIAKATVDRGRMTCEVFVTFAGVSCVQFMKALKPTFMSQSASREHNLLQERGIPPGIPNRLEPEKPP